MVQSPHFLVLDAYPREGRAALARAGATAAGHLYARILQRLVADARVDILYPADPDAALPAGAALEQYHGVTWTGSSLTIHHDGAPVRRHIALVRAIAAARIPSFGSCWAAQLSIVAAGGRCAANPRGREFGVAQQITLSPEGRAHPLYAGKPAVFDAFTSHADEVVDLAAGATLLASNRFSRVQAVAIDRGRASFWAVQYHPEYDLHEIARLCVLRADELIAQAMFPDRTAVETYIDQLETLHRDRTRADLARRLQVSDELLDETQRTIEVRNWVEYQVLPAMS